MKRIFKLQENRNVERAPEDQCEGSDPNILSIKSRLVLRTTLWASQKIDKNILWSCPLETEILADGKSRVH